MPTQYYEYHTNPERWSDELRLVSKPGGRFHWLGGPVLGEDPRQELRQHLLHAGAAVPTVRRSSTTTAYSGTPAGLDLAAGRGVVRATPTRSDYLQTTEFANINFDLTDKLNVEAGVVHFHSDFKYYSPYGQFAYQPTSPGLSRGLLAQVGQQVRHQLQAHRQGAWCTPTFAQGFRDGGSNSGFPPSCYNNGVPQTYMPDTLNNYEIGWKTTSLNGRLIWNGATYLMDWKQLQTHHLRPERLRLEQLLRQRRGCAHLRRRIERRLQDQRQLVAAGRRPATPIRASFRAPTPPFQPDVGERLPFVAVLQLELERALRASAQRAAARATRSSTWPTRATCGTT